LNVGTFEPPQGIEWLERLERAAVFVSNANASRLDLAAELKESFQKNRASFPK